jgi:hypothetical protein
MTHHMGNNSQTNNFEISGKCIHIGQPEQYTTKAGTTVMTKRVVIEVFTGTYANEVEFEFSNANTNQLLQVIEGKWITINFCLRGNKTLKDGKAKWWPKLEGLTVLIG